jgi:hypothetical protein
VSLLRCHCGTLAQAEGWATGWTLSVNVQVVEFDSGRAVCVVMHGETQREVSATGRGPDFEIEREATVFRSYAPNVPRRGRPRRHYERQRSLIAVVVRPHPEVFGVVMPRGVEHRPDAISVSTNDRVHRSLDCDQLGVSELRSIEIAGVLRQQRDGTRSGVIPERWPSRAAISSGA